MTGSMEETVRALQGSLQQQLDSHIKSQNLAFQEQLAKVKLAADESQVKRERVLAHGWNLVTIFLLLITVLFVLAFTFELLKAEHVESIEASLAQERATNSALREQFQKNALEYTSLYNTMARADAIMAEANREYSRNDWQSASNFATRAIDGLRNAQRGPGPGQNENFASPSSFNPNTCTLDSPSGTEAPPKPADLHPLDPSGLQPAIREYLRQSYETRFRSNYYARQRDWKQRIREDAESLARLDLNSGYHWFGLVEAAELDTKHAITCFEKSIHQSSNLFKRDYVNLAELEFMEGKCCYARVITLTETFLEGSATSDLPFENPIEAVAAFYWSIGKQLQASSTAAAGQNYLQTFQMRIAKSPSDLTTVGSFNDAELENYLKTTTDLNSQQAVEIEKAKECMVSRKCSDQTPK
jgi:hypothetical protein